FFVENSFPQQKHLQARNRIARSIGGSLGLRTVEPLVVGKRMGIGPDYMGMHKRRTMPAAAVLSRSPQGRIGYRRIGAVKLFEMKVGEARDETRDITARSLYLDGHGDRVSIVLNEKNYWQSA